MTDEQLEATARLRGWIPVDLEGRSLRVEWYSPSTGQFYWLRSQGSDSLQGCNASPDYTVFEVLVYPDHYDVLRAMLAKGLL